MKLLRIKFKTLGAAKVVIGQVLKDDWQLTMESGVATLDVRLADHVDEEQWIDNNVNIKRDMFEVKFANTD